MAKKNSRKNRQANKKTPVANSSNHISKKTHYKTKTNVENKEIKHDVDINNESNDIKKENINEQPKKKFWTKKKKLITIICLPIVLIAILCSIIIPIAVNNSNKQLDSPYITLNAGKISWNKVKNATIYDIYSNSKKLDQTVDYTYDLTGLESGSYEVFIVAKAPGKKYAESNRVNYVKTKLESPTIIVLDDKVSWNSVPNAIGYEIYFDGKLHTTVTECEYVPDIVDGKVIITVKALANEIDYGKSNFSNEEEFNKIKTPVLNLSTDGLYLVWDEIENCRGYIVLINDNENLLTENQLLLPTEIGKYSVKIKAIASDGYVSSNFSFAYEFIVWGEIEKVTNLSSVDNKITFDQVAGALEYEIYVRSYDSSEFVLVGKTKTNSFVYENIEYGYYTVKVKTIADESLFYRGSSESDEYIMRYLARLDSPTLLLIAEQDVLSWTEVSNAISYNIYNNGELLYSGVNQLSINLMEGFYKLTKVGYYNLAVVAVSDWINYADSLPSNEVQYIVYTQLDKPIISLANDTITITKVENADYYDVYVDDKLTKSSSDLTITIGLTCEQNQSRKYSIYVVAKSNDPNVYKDSIKSELYRVVVSGQEKKISQGEIGFNSTSYELSTMATGIDVSLTKGTSSYQSIYGSTAPYFPVNDPKNPTNTQCEYGYVINQNDYISITVYSTVYVQIFYRGTGSGKITFGYYTLVELDSSIDTVSATTMAISAGTYLLKSTKDVFIMKVIITTDKSASNYNYEVYSKEEIVSRVRTCDNSQLSGNALSALSSKQTETIELISKETDMDVIELYYNEFLIYVSHLATNEKKSAALALIPNDNDYEISQELMAEILELKSKIENAVYIDDIKIVETRLNEILATLVKKNT